MIQNLTMMSSDKKTLATTINSVDSEVAIKLIEIKRFAKKVFESSGKSHLWFNTPSFALGNIKPVELLK